MLVLVPTVSAKDLEALLTYMYRGEFQVLRADLPSIMKAAKTLKIKGFCNTNVEEVDQYESTECPEEGKTNTKESNKDNDSRDSICFVSPDSPEEIAQEPRHLPKLRKLKPNGPKSPQVWTF